MSLKSFYYFGKMWRNPRKSPRDIQKLQLKKLKAVTTHAYNNSPFYHAKLKEAGLHPSDIASLDEISKIPFTTKEELREAGKTVVAENIPLKKCYTETTSGSTGKKLEMIHSYDARAFRYAVFYRIYLSWGMRPFKRISDIRFTPLAPTLLEKLGITKSYYISTFMDADEQFDLIFKQNPHILVGHPPDLVNMAKIARSRGTVLNLDFIGSNSELLTQKERAFIEETFCCPVYEEYSSFEIGFMAQSCIKKRMHIISDAVIMECIKDGEPVTPGESGEVVVTLLFPDATPFIRYKHRDVASLSEEGCDCGITFPVMDVIEGRKDDFIVLPSGKEISPTRLVPLFFEFEHIKDFNIIQTSPRNVTVNVVPHEPFGEKEEETLLQLVTRELEGMDIAIRCVTSIKKTPQGKKRAVINLIKKDEI
jgi:phenylacetate-CoA ligase